MPETNELMKRPTRTSQLVIKRALETGKGIFERYLRESFRESEWDEIQKQIAQVVSSHGDGYSWARELENRHGWCEDRGLMDALDEFDHHIYRAHKEILKQWIVCYKIEPSRKVGDTVSIHHGEKTGEIVKINLEEATYNVHTPEQPATSSWVIPFEDASDVKTDVDQQREAWKQYRQHVSHAYSDATTPGFFEAPAPPPFPDPDKKEDTDGKAD